MTENADNEHKTSIELAATIRNVLEFFRAKNSRIRSEKTSGAWPKPTSTAAGSTGASKYGGRGALALTVPSTPTPATDRCELALSALGVSELIASDARMLMETPGQTSSPKALDTECPAGADDVAARNAKLESR